jgi:hypothetical protein
MRWLKGLKFPDGYTASLIRSVSDDMEAKLFL